MFMFDIVCLLLIYECTTIITVQATSNPELENEASQQVQLFCSETVPKFEFTFPVGDYLLLSSTIKQQYIPTNFEQKRFSLLEEKLKQNSKQEENFPNDEAENERKEVENEQKHESNIEAEMIGNQNQMLHQVKEETPKKRKRKRKKYKNIQKQNFVGGGGDDDVGIVVDGGDGGGHSVDDDDASDDDRKLKQKNGNTKKKDDSFKTDRYRRETEKENRQMLPYSTQSQHVFRLMNWKTGLLNVISFEAHEIFGKFLSS